MNANSPARTAPIAAKNPDVSPLRPSACLSSAPSCIAGVRESPKSSASGARRFWTAPIWPGLASTRIRVILPSIPSSLCISPSGNTATDAVDNEPTVSSERRIPSGIVTVRPRAWILTGTGRPAVVGFGSPALSATLAVTSTFDRSVTVSGSNTLPASCFAIRTDSGLADARLTGTSPPGPEITARWSSSGAASLTPGVAWTSRKTPSSNPFWSRACNCRSASPTIPATISSLDFEIDPFAIKTAYASATPIAIPTTASRSNFPLRPDPVDEMGPQQQRAHAIRRSIGMISAGAGIVLPRSLPPLIVNSRSTAGIESVTATSTASPSSEARDRMSACSRSRSVGPAASAGSSSTRSLGEASSARAIVTRTCSCG